MESIRALQNDAKMEWLNDVLTEETKSVRHEARHNPSRATFVATKPEEHAVSKIKSDPASPRTYESRLTEIEVACPMPENEPHETAPSPAMNEDPPQPMKAPTAIATRVYLVYEDLIKA